MFSMMVVVALMGLGILFREDATVLATARLIWYWPFGFGTADTERTQIYGAVLPPYASQVHPAELW